MMKKTLEYIIPIQNNDIVNKLNNMLKKYYGDKKFEPYKTTEEHVETLIDKILDAIDEVGEAGGWYTCDGIKVKVELEYKSESK